MNKKLVAFLLVLTPLAVSAMQPSSETEWVRALDRGNAKEVEVLLQKGRNAKEFSKLPALLAPEIGKATLEFKKVSPLDVAWYGKGSQENRLKIVESLIKQGADENDAWQKVVMVFALINGNVSVVKELAKLRNLKFDLEGIIEELQKLKQRNSAEEQRKYQELIEFFESLKSK